MTGGLEEDALADAFEAQHDDYNKIMVKALADRLAEAFAEYLHERVRKVYWGYAPNENLSNEELIRENYCGIRPATGLSGLPGTYGKSHHLGAAGSGKHTGMKLTESFAMWLVHRFRVGTSATRTASITRWRKSSAIRLKTMPAVKV